MSTSTPGARLDHTLALTNNVLILIGGYDDNVVYDDTWYYNLTTNRWLEKTSFVHALYPDWCTDDLAYINDTHNNCSEMTWTKSLSRYSYSPFEVKPWGSQSYYYPDPDLGPWWGLLEKGEPLPPPGFPKRTSAMAGDPIYPYAATAPRQYARPFVYHFNLTHNATFYESCLSVKGDPTRGTTLDGLAGRASGPILIPQPRRQAPGWDGCRDRVDNRSDLVQALQWAHPTSRSQHTMVFSKTYHSIILYGGQGYRDGKVATKTSTYMTYALSDMWMYNVNRCPANCSNHGDCYMGFCFCHHGYYGVDCSNTSCPGDFCYYDETSLQQVCVHCCSAGYNHTDNDTYVLDARKVPCSKLEPGESNGVCDGFGTCQCAPPFLGDDCSIKDCTNNCSFNGYCSVEYPVSRCLCLPGYFGDYCQYKECLNNCTYPNGVCNYTTGSCACRMMYVPFNNTRAYYPFAGEDCSWIVAFAGAGTMWGWGTLIVNLGCIIALSTVLHLVYAGT